MDACIEVDIVCTQRHWDNVVNIDTIMLEYNCNNEAHIRISQYNSIFYTVLWLEMYHCMLTIKTIIVHVVDAVLRYLYFA